MKLMKKVSSITILFVWVFAMLTQCTSDVVSPPVDCDNVTPTYTSDIKSIIDQTCAYSGCHDGSGGLGPGNYSSYNGILPDLRNGSFADRVINQRDNPVRGMPPNRSIYPESQQDDLTEIQFQLMSCWLQNGFAE